MEQPKVLIVDDDPNARDGLRLALEPAGYGCLTASAGTEALRILESEDVDVLISDIKMPGMDGLALFQRTKLVSPATSVILVTAYGDVESAVQAMKEGAFDYITKPVNLAEIELSVVRALGAAQRALWTGMMELRGSTGEWRRLHRPGRPHD